MPTIDPKNLPPSANMEGYQVTSYQTTLQRSFERWLSSPSPTTERLVDQALIGAGRSPMFGRVGASAQFVKPFEMPWQARSTRQREIFDFSRQANERMLADARLRRTVQSRAPSYDIQQAFSRGYGGNLNSMPPPRGFSSRAEWSTSPRYSQQVSAGSTWVPTMDTVRLFKRMDTTLIAMLGEERRVRMSLETGPAGTASVGTQNLWRSPRFPQIPQGTGLAASPQVSQAFAQMLNQAAGGGGGIPPFTPPGGGGGGPGGGGGGGGGPGAFAGGILGGAFSRRGLRATWPFLAGEAAWQGAKMPLHAGHFLYNLYGSSKQYTDWHEQLANLTRLPEGAGPMAPGMARRNLESGLLPGFQGALPPWMPELGVAQPLAADILGRVGGKRPGQEPLSVIENLRRLRLGSGFTMAPEGSVESLANTGMKFGIGPQSNPAAFPKAFAQFMAQGQAGGAEATDLLASIKNSTESLAKTGIKLDMESTSGWADFMQRMLTVNMPDARSGAMGARAITGLTGALESPFQNVPTALVTSMALRRVDWSNEADVKKYTGKSIDELKNDPLTKTAIELAQQKNFDIITQQFASRLLATKEGMNLVTDVIKSIGPAGPYGDAIRDMIMSALQKQGLATAAGTMAARDAVRPADRPGAAEPLRGTTPDEVYRSRVEAFTDLFRGLYTDFEIFGKHLEDLNRILERVADHAFGPGTGPSLGPGFDIGKSLWKMSPFGGSTPPSSSGLGDVWGGIKNFFGFGDSGTASPGMTPSPSGGSSVPRGGGRFGALAPQGAPLPTSTLAAISMAEGTFQGGHINYDDMLGHPGGRLGTPPKPISQMNLSELDKWQTQMLRNPNNRWNSSAAGGFQITRTNVRDLSKRWNLDPETTVFDQPLQDRMASQLWRQQGSGAWEGFKAHPELRSRAEALAGTPGSGLRVSYSAPANDATGADYGGGGSTGGHAELSDSFGFLGRIVRETAEHLHDLGHGARNARSGLGGSSAGPNSASSPASAPTAAAYP